MNKISSADYCKNFVREARYDLYLLHFFIERRIRRRALSLMALHCELLSIPRKAIDPHMISLRLSWWYDQIIGIINGEKKPNGPILEELHLSLQITPIKKDDFEAYFDVIAANILMDESEVKDRAFEKNLILTLVDHKDKKRIGFLMDALRKMEHPSAFKLFIKDLHFKLTYCSNKE
jgi:hypothetical protein